MGRRRAETFDISERALAFALRFHASARAQAPARPHSFPVSYLLAFPRRRRCVRWAAFRKPRSARPPASSSTGSRRCLPTGARTAGMWTRRQVGLDEGVPTVTSLGRSRCRRRPGEAGIIMLTALSCHPPRAPCHRLRPIRGLRAVRPLHLWERHHRRMSFTLPPRPLRPTSFHSMPAGIPEAREMSKISQRC